MAQRRAVFQSKVLQKLYPPKAVKESSPSHMVESLTKKTHAAKRKTSGEDTLHGRSQSTANQSRRMYTVLPPPPGYDIQSLESVTLPQLRSINSAEDPAAEEKVQKHSEDSDEDTEEEEEEEEHKQRRRRKKKRKSNPRSDAGKEGEPSGSRTDRGETPADAGGERMSKNKKRKLKKKRHKEKLLAMGLMPRAAAVEFTYQKDEDEEKEDQQRKAEEVSEFLRTTMESYLSDSSLHAAGVPQLSATVDELLESLARGGRPGRVLRQLHHLKALVQRGEADELEKALKELGGASVLSAEETAAVVSLFQYWITHILPMQGDEKSELSTTHP
ncbi:unnamed protein product [Ophioblennius macclurei]